MLASNVPYGIIRTRKGPSIDDASHNKLVEMPAVRASGGPKFHSRDYLFGLRFYYAP